MLCTYSILYKLDFDYGLTQKIAIFISKLKGNFWAISLRFRIAINSAESILT